MGAPHGEPLRELCSRHWRWAAGLGVVFAAVGAAIVLGTVRG